MLRIRQARPEEAELLSDLAYRSKAAWGYDEQFMQACRGELTYRADDFPLYYFAVAEDPQVVGFYALNIVTDKHIELHALFVEPGYMRQGYGTALLNHAKIQASVLGAKTLSVQTDPNAEAFYTALGAKHTGTQPSDSIPGRELATFEFALNQTPKNC